MAEHENTIGKTSEWYTPREIFDALGCRFDLDPCSPGKDHWVPADKIYTVEDNGLLEDWDGFVFMNPPFGGRNGHIPWLQRFLTHGNGIAIVRAYTSAKWFHDYAVNVDAIVFPRGKTKFVREDGSIGKSPGHGAVLLGCGKRAIKVLHNCRLGLFINLDSNRFLYGDEYP